MRLIGSVLLGIRPMTASGGGIQGKLWIKLTGDNTGYLVIPSTILWTVHTWITNKARMGSERGTVPG